MEFRCAGWIWVCGLCGLCQADVDFLFTSCCTVRIFVDICLDVGPLIYMDWRYFVRVSMYFARRRMESCLVGRLAWTIDVRTESAMIGCWKLTHCGPLYFAILTSKDAGKLMQMA